MILNPRGGREFFALFFKKKKTFLVYIRIKKMCRVVQKYILFSNKKKDF